MALAFDPAKFLAETAARLGQLRADQRKAFTDLLAFMADDERLVDVRHAAYMLATAWWETARTMEPISERGPVRYFDRYDPVRATTAARRRRAKEMGNTAAGDGYRYRGRGYVQLTWKNNYRQASDLVGVDLVADPDRAMDPALAYRIMSHGMRHGWFTGKKLDDYISGTRCNYVTARRIINGDDEAKAIANFAHSFEAALNASRVTSTTEQPKQEPPAAKPAGFWSTRDA